MIKEIRYTGLTVRPSDLDCPDGDLALPLNLINDGDGTLRPIEAPSVLFDLGEDFPGKVIFVHSVVGQDNFIIATPVGLHGAALSWMRKGSVPGRPSGSASPVEIELREALASVNSVTAIGNTLCLATATSLQYFLWKDGAYIHLGSRPPFLSIRFGCFQSGRIEEKVDTDVEGTEDMAAVLGWWYYPVLTPSGKVHFGNEKEKEAWRKVCDKAMGDLMVKLNDDVFSKGYFHQPFYIRYAYRLYDGSYAFHSPPVLMTPDVIQPLIAAYINLEKIRLDFNIPFFSIAHRILGDVEGLKEWADIIAGIDFFISPPIYSYRQEADTEGPYSMSYMFGLEQGSHYLGTFADFDAGEYKEHYVGELFNGRDEYYLLRMYIGFEPNESFEDHLKHTQLFYKVKSIDIKEIRETSKMQQLNLDQEDLTVLTSLERLPDDYNSHATIIPGSVFSYNNRLLLTDLSVIPATPFRLFSSVQAIDSSEPVSAIDTVRVFTRVDGLKCVSEYTAERYNSNESAPVEYPVSRATFPRYIYHPDPSAYMMEIDCGNEVYRLPLTPHPFLNGAYWFGGVNSSKPAGGAAADTTSNTMGALPNRVYISRVSNPFIFPAESIVTIPCGRIMGISTAARALSQGQFGQYPLYAFTSDGVWALQIADDGVISARQPITRDVCTNPDGITQIDSAVLFPTSRGIMLIAGSQTQCISDAINSSLPFSLSSFKGASVLLDGADTALTTPGEAFSGELEPFHIFLEDARMAYDYPGQRIIVFNPTVPYFYIYSLRSSMWTLAHGSLSYVVNSYPDALVADTAGRLLNFSVGSGIFPPGMLLTRPLKLDIPSVLKSVTAAIQRGQFRKGAVAAILYGSRDLIHWHPVWSSTSHVLRGFSGTPYKYFRLGLKLALAEGESLSGVSIEFTPRFTNRLR